MSDAVTLEVVATSPRVPRANARAALAELLEATTRQHPLRTSRDVLLIVRASQSLTVRDVNAITAEIECWLHPDAELEVDASVGLKGGDDVELSIALPKSAGARPGEPRE